MYFIFHNHKLIRIIILCMYKIINKDIYNTEKNEKIKNIMPFTKIKHPSNYYHLILYSFHFWHQNPHQNLHF